MDKKDKFITITDEDNTEHLAEVLFTFEHQKENFVFFMLKNDLEKVSSIEDEFDVLVYKYEELEDGTIGNLIEIPEWDEKTWTMVEEMFETFQSSNGFDVEW